MKIDATCCHAISPGDIPSAEASCPRAVLVALDRDSEHTKLVLSALHERLPRVPVGLVISEADRDVALQWLRERRVDRLIPKNQFETGSGGHVAALLSHGARLASLYDKLGARPQRTLLVTGATGFLGGHFLRYLLRCGSDRVIAVTRSNRGTSAQERLAYLQRLHPARIRCIEGDVCQPGLGLPAAARARLKSEVDEVWHLAASTKFEEVLRDEIFRVNLGGTINVLGLARGLPRLRRFHHVSTAYAAGNWAESCPVPEERLKRPPGFKNPYEESKFLAEEAVADSGLPATIYRPSIILGETVSGLCDGQTVYNVAKMLRLARLAGERAAKRTGAFGSFRVAVDPGAAKNLVPVDTVVDRMLRIAAGEPDAGGYYNLAHERPTPMTELIHVIAKLLDIPQYQAVRELDCLPLSAAESVLERVAGVFRPYMLRCDPTFETRHAREVGEPFESLEKDRLRFLLRAFFEQHYNWAFEPARASV